MLLKLCCLCARCVYIYHHSENSAVLCCSMHACHALSSARLIYFAVKLQSLSLAAQHAVLVAGLPGQALGTFTSACPLVHILRYCLRATTAPPFGSQGARRTHPLLPGLGYLCPLQWASVLVLTRGAMLQRTHDNGVHVLAGQEKEVENRRERKHGLQCSKMYSVRSRPCTPRQPPLPCRQWHRAALDAADETLSQAGPDDGQHASRCQLSFSGCGPCAAWRAGAGDG